MRKTEPPSEKTKKSLTSRPSRQLMAERRPLHDSPDYHWSLGLFEIIDQTYMENLRKLTSKSDFDRKWKEADQDAFSRSRSDGLHFVFGAAGDSFLAKGVKQGVPVTAIYYLIDHNVLHKSEVESLVLPRRTLAHRELKRESLNQAESERLLRVSRIVAFAEDTFNNREKAGIWLRRPNRLFEGKTPLEMAGTEPGGRIVESVLRRIAHGMAA